MEQLVMSIAEKTLVGFGFVYLLHFFLTKVANTLDTVSQTLTSMTEKMSSITDTLSDISKTMEQMDARIKILEEKR